jgi:hypothetical protein
MCPAWARVSGSAQTDAGGKDRLAAMAATLVVVKFRRDMKVFMVAVPLFLEMHASRRA